jgi:hypothetical protein
MEWLYPLSGFVVGAVVGLTGMGGGSLMTPLLILLFGLHPVTAVGTDLLYAAVTKTAGTAIHSRRGNVDWSVAALLAAGSIPATVLTIWVLSLMPREDPGACRRSHANPAALAQSRWSSVLYPAFLCRCARSAPEVRSLRCVSTVAFAFRETGRETCHSPRR